MTTAAAKETKPTAKGADSRASRAAGHKPPYAMPELAPPEALGTLQRKVQDERQAPIQRQKSPGESNSTGLPDALKSGVEQLSGMSLDSVRVHYNSDKPAQLKSHAYAQGTEIHVGPGQESSLPHEAWHVVQQLEGRVKPTMQFKGHVPINNDAGLENEADIMGAKALAAGSALYARPPGDHAPEPLQTRQSGTALPGIIQGKWYAEVVSTRPDLAPWKVGGPVFDEVEDRIKVERSDTKKIYKIKAGQETLDGTRLQDKDPFKAELIQYILVDQDTLQIVDGHHRFVAGAVHGYQAPFADQPSTDQTVEVNKDEWKDMTWMEGADPKSSRLRAKILNEANNEDVQNSKVKNDKIEDAQNSKVQNGPKKSVNFKDVNDNAEFQKLVEAFCQRDGKARFEEDNDKVLKALQKKGLIKYTPGNVSDFLKKRGYLPVDFRSEKDVENALTGITDGKMGPHLAKDKEKKEKDRKLQNLKQQDSKKLLLAADKVDVPNVNPNDISVGQGFYVVKTKGELNGGNFGLQTDGVGPCIAVALSDPDRNVFAFSHFDSQTDAQKAIDAMLLGIDAKIVQQANGNVNDAEVNPNQRKYHAWLGTSSKRPFHREVKAALQQRGVLLHTSYTDKTQYRVDPQAEDIDRNLVATKDSPFAPDLYEAALADSVPLPFKKAKAELRPHALEIFAQLADFLEAFGHNMVPDKDQKLDQKLQTLFAENKNVASSCAYLMSTKIYDVKTMTIPEAVEILAVALELIDKKGKKTFKDGTQLRNRLSYALAMGREFLKYGSKDAAYLSGMSNFLVGLGKYL